MNRQQAEFRFQFMLIAIVALATILSAGRGGAMQSRSSSNETGLPDYIPGTTFIFADGTRETVLSSTADRVAWKNHEGSEYSGSPDFTRRPQNWQSPRLKVKRTFGERTDLLFKGPTSLWPLREGNKASYMETGVWTDESGAERTYRAYWSCEVVGRERVSVPAGLFDSYEIECRRYSVSSSLKSRLRQVDTWFYSPAVGHYVLKESRYTSGKPPELRELLAVIPAYDRWSPAARLLIDESLQAALEKNVSGVPASWEYNRDKLSGATVPTETFQLANGAYCRRYAQTIIQPHKQETYHGMACRNLEGAWYIPQQ